VRWKLPSNKGRGFTPWSKEEQAATTSTDRQGGLLLRYQMVSISAGGRKRVNQVSNIYEDTEVLILLHAVEERVSGRIRFRIEVCRP
jgi:hypothetical protein